MDGDPLENTLRPIRQSGRLKVLAGAPQEELLELGQPPKRAYKHNKVSLIVSAAVLVFTSVKRKMWKTEQVLSLRFVFRGLSDMV